MEGAKRGGRFEVEAEDGEDVGGEGEVVAGVEVLKWVVKRTVSEKGRNFSRVKRMGAEEAIDGGGRKWIKGAMTCKTCSCLRNAGASVVKR
jgi:hypothetical protein